jgi:hypothetical protein
MVLPKTPSTKEIESNIIDITDRLLQVTPMRYKMTPWLIKRSIKAYIAWVTLPLYFVNVMMNKENGSD